MNSVPLAQAAPQARELKDLVLTDGQLAWLGETNIGLPQGRRALLVAALRARKPVSLQELADSTPRPTTDAKPTARRKRYTTEAVASGLRDLTKQGHLRVERLSKGNRWHHGLLRITAGPTVQALLVWHGLL